MNNENELTQLVAFAEQLWEDAIDNVVPTVVKTSDKKVIYSDCLIDKYNHIQNCLALANEIRPNDLMLKCLILYHDIGRISQYNIWERFADDKMLHHYLGVDFFESCVLQGEIPNSKYNSLIIATILYHGRLSLLPSGFVTDKERKYIEIVTTIDNLENGCLGAVGYLDREVEIDAKGYGQVDQDLVSPDVLEYYKNIEKFDKMKYCKTYADYTLFAIILALVQLKGEYKDIAVAAMSRPVTDSFGIAHANAIDGYKAIIDRRIEPQYRKLCFNVLLETFSNAKKNDN